MATNLQFPIAAHIMGCLAYRNGKETTSQQLSMSINTSPSFVRRTLAKLAKAGLVVTTKGSNGHCRLSTKASEISMLDIYKAIEPPKAFSIHDYKPQKRCPVSCCVKSALEKVLDQSQKALEGSLSKTSLAKFASEFKEP